MVAKHLADGLHSPADTWWLFCPGLSWRLCDGIQALAFEATYFQFIEALVVERICVSSSCQLLPVCGQYCFRCFAVMSVGRCAPGVRQLMVSSFSVQLRELFMYSSVQVLIFLLCGTIVTRSIPVCPCSCFCFATLARRYKLSALMWHSADVYLHRHYYGAIHLCNNWMSV